MPSVLWIEITDAVWFASAWKRGVSQVWAAIPFPMNAGEKQSSIDPVANK
jgi:hypothetical protein